ncbi:MAG TPA: glycosyltransferase family 2 protein [Gemmatimonadales bacterium]|jgi:GT2 family glycosyltransferase
MTYPREGVRDEAGVVRSLHWGECLDPGDPLSQARAVETGYSVAICTYRRPDSLLRLLRSVALQQPQPAQLVIVDASPDDATERVVAGWVTEHATPRCVLYYRVADQLRGLTRQRNFALARVSTDLVAFFDDDIVLRDGCLDQMQQVHRRRPDVVGVGALIANHSDHPDLVWRLRRLLFMVPNLSPGRYYASGVSTPWWPARMATAPEVEGDWLPGGATMWRTVAARETGFVEGFDGYGSGEDLEFSLRVSRQGKLVMAAAAQVEHLHERGGRPDEEELGYATLRNHHSIHSASWGRFRWAQMWFAYATLAESLLQSVHLVRPHLSRGTWRYLRGTLRYVQDWRRSAAR